MKKSTAIILVAVALLVGGYVGYLLTHQDERATGVTASSVGVTNSSARIASIIIAPATGSATSTSILNNDSTDRAIESSFAACTGFGTSKTAYSGGGLASLLVRMATTSTAITQSLADVNSNYAANLTIGTSTVDGLTASSTDGVLSGLSRIWPTGAYLTIQPNATNTATCTVGIHYLSL